MKRRRICAFFLALLFGMVSVVHAADCQKTAESCVEGPETRNIGGYPVHRDCWRYRSQFSCVSQAMTDDCQPLRDRGCSQIGSICIDTNPLGACMLHEQTWQCRVASGSTSTITNCGGQQFCLDGHCFDTGNAPDADFAKMVTALEVQREAGKYVGPHDPGGFPGLRQPLPQEALRPGQLLQGCRIGRIALQQPEPDPRRRGAGDGRGGVELHLRRAIRVRRPRTWPSPASKRCSELGAAPPHWPASWPAISRWHPSLRPWYPAHGPSPYWRSSSRASSPASSRTDSRHEARQPALSRCRQLLLVTPANHSSLHRDHRVLLLLQLAPGPHPQRAGTRPARPRLGRRRKPRLQRLYRRAIAGARLLPDEPRGVLRRDRADLARRRHPALPCPTKINGYFGP
jgi:hypothetical protein